LHFPYAVQIYIANDIDDRSDGIKIILGGLLVLADTVLVGVMVVLGGVTTVKLEASVGLALL
jgi:hypothetical protein